MSVSVLRLDGLTEGRPATAAATSAAGVGRRAPLGAAECYAVSLLPAVEMEGDAAACPQSEGGEC